MRAMINAESSLVHLDVDELCFFIVLTLTYLCDLWIPGHIKYTNVKEFEVLRHLSPNSTHSINHEKGLLGTSILA